jgi:hypothetical protein
MPFRNRTSTVLCKLVIELVNESIHGAACCGGAGTEGIPAGFESAADANAFARKRQQHQSVRANSLILPQ